MSFNSAEELRDNIMYTPWEGTRTLLPRLHYSFLTAPPLSLHFLPCLISKCLNLPFGTQTRWRRKAFVPRSPITSCLVSRREGKSHACGGEEHSRQREQPELLEQRKRGRAESGGGGQAFCITRRTAGFTRETEGVTDGGTGVGWKNSFCFSFWLYCVACVTSLPRDWTHVPCNGSAESWPLDH